MPSSPYLGPSYFGARYFGAPGVDAPPPAGRMFGTPYFGARYFGGSYFGTGTADAAPPAAILGDPLALVQSLRRRRVAGPARRPTAFKSGGHVAGVAATRTTGTAV